MKVQIVLNMQNPKQPIIGISYSGWLLAKVLARFIKLEVIVHKGGNDYSIPQLKKEDANALLRR